MHQIPKHCKRMAIAALTAWLMTSGLHAAKLEDSHKVVKATNSSAANSQKKIDQLSRESQALLDEYRRLRNGIEYQDAYTLELEQLDASQQQQIGALQRQIEEARITQQRIVPLMRSMADALEKLVVLDLPFHHEQRIGSVLQLKQRLRQPGLSISSRFRLLLEAYQLEQDYGLNIEAWRGPLQLEGEQLSVEYLRIGRVALYYHSLNGESSGYWDSASQSWQALAAAYNQPIAAALRVAKNQSAPQLLTLPMAMPGGTS
jgi:cell division protein FtsB